MVTRACPHQRQLNGRLGAFSRRGLGQLHDGERQIPLAKPHGSKMATTRSERASERERTPDASVDKIDSAMSARRFPVKATSQQDGLVSRALDGSLAVGLSQVE